MIRWDHVRFLLPGQLFRVLPRLLIVLAKLDQARALGAHSSVFLGTVTKWNDDSHWNTEALSRERHRLAVIAPRGRDQTFDSLPLPEQFRRIHDCRSRLEGADGRVILVFYPDFGC